jgi:hypothetical protein
MENRSMLPEQGAQIIRDYLSGQIPDRPRRRLSGAKQWIVLLLVLVATLAIYIGLYPWGFFMGGDFHPRPRLRAALHKV